jgi:hypothetical protein
MSLFFRLLFFFLFIASASFAQKDSSRSDMSFDFGWTRNRNVNLWPILKKSKTKDQKDVQAIFTLFRYNKNRKAGTKHIHLLPLVVKDSSAAKQDLRLFTLFYPSLLRFQKDSVEGSRSFIIFDIAPKINFLELTKSKDGLFVQNNLFFFLWYKNNQVTKRTHLVAFPLYWQYKNPDYKSITFAPVFSKGQSTDLFRKHLMVTPFFLHLKYGYGYRNVLFPLWWYKNSGTKLFQDKYNVILPLYWSFKNTNGSRKILFPFIWSSKKASGSTFAFVPFFSIKRSADSSESNFSVTPFFWHKKTKYSYANILFPIWWYKSSGTGEARNSHNVVFPIYWSYKSRNSNSKVLFPLIWSLKNHDYRTFAVMPFFSIGHSPDSTESHIGITPLFWHWQKPGENRNIFFPLWWNKTEGTGEYKEHYNVVFPVYWSYKNKYSNSKVIFPLVWNLKKQKNIHKSFYHTFAIMPFFSIGKAMDSTKADRLSHVGITPFFWHYKYPDGYRNVLFPIWWNKRTGTGVNEKYSNVIFPLYWEKKYKDKEYKVIFPVLWLTKSDTGENTRQRSILFPLLWIKKDKKVNNTILFPLVWSLKNKRYQSFTLFPLFSGGRTVDKQKSHLITPLFCHFKNKESRTNIYFAFWWSIRRDTGVHAALRTVLFPLVWTKKDKNTHNVVILPFIYSLKNKVYKSFTLAPIFSAGHSEDRKSRHYAITPLFWHFKKPAGHKEVLFPLYSYASDTAHNSKFDLLFFLLRYKGNKQYKSMNFIWPLCEYTKAPDMVSFRFAPIFWYKKSSALNYFSIQPFYYHSISKESERFNILWELFSYKHYFNQKRSVSFFWKLLYYDKYDNKDHEFRLLYLLYANVKKEGNIEKSIFPLYHYTTTTEGGRSFSVLLKFYSSLTRPIEDSKEFYKETKVFWFLRIRSNYDYLKQKGVKNIKP